MKQVIDGKLYNTETAIEIGSYWNGLSNIFRLMKCSRSFLT